jgi:hypothetical protein
MDWKATIATVAPAIATALGGPLAGVAVQMAGKAIGLGDGATQGDIEAAVLSGNPDVLVKLREVNTQFERDMKALDIDLERIHASDRASARDLGKVDLRPQIALSFVFIGGYFGALFSLHGILFESAEMNSQVVALFGALVGVFTRELSGIMTFWFGSSSGSKVKTHEITKGLSP